MISSYFVSSTIQTIEKYYPEYADNLGSDLEYDVSGHYVTLSSFFSLLERLSDVSGQADIGLNLGVRVAPACFNLQGQLVMSCATLGDALHSVLRFHTLILPGSKIGIELRSEIVRFIWKMPDWGDLPRVFVDLVVASTCQFGAWITGGETHIPVMGFVYDEPANKDVYAHIFRGDQIFRQPFNFVEVPVVWRELEIKTASINLKPVLEVHAETLLDELNQSAGYQMQLERMLLNMIQNGEVTIEDLASRVGTSPRTLQRELCNQALSFSQLLRRVREKRARFLLSKTTLPITEIALELGYQTSSSFSKAYKQWTGVSPLSLRKKHDNQMADYVE